GLARGLGLDGRDHLPAVEPGERPSPSGGDPATERGKGRHPRSDRGMNLVFAPNGWEDYLHWQATDKAMLRKLNRLIEDCLRHPFEGTGKPEPLRGDLAGLWSRRIDREHRLVYRTTATSLEVVQCRYHY